MPRGSAGFPMPMEAQDMMRVVAVGYVKPARRAEQISREADKALPRLSLRARLGPCVKIELAVNPTAAAPGHG